MNGLLNKKLVTGGQFVHAPARFLWKGKMFDMDYCTILSFTIAANRDAIIAEVKSTSVEEVPMITFTAIDGNEDLLRWIDQTLGCDI